MRKPPDDDVSPSPTVSGDRSLPVLMHPVVFVSAFTLLGLLFASQEWMNLRHSGYKMISPALVFESWGLQYFLWGVFCWVLWRIYRDFIQTADLRRIIVIVVPVSILSCFFQEIVWVACFPQIPVDHPHMTYWHRVSYNFTGDIVESMAIFWSTFLVCRGIGYYQQWREKETVAAQLAVQLANARISALRMQLNPHFLFNTMNSISSLMRTDIDAADAMLEQLSSLLRMTLERKDVQLIPLHEEIEFTETYLAMQDLRYMGRITRTLSVDPELYDALVPAMFLQPIIENAFVHGLSKVERGELLIEVTRNHEQLQAVIRNSGQGLRKGSAEAQVGHGVGLTNVKNRLRLHYGEKCSFSMIESDQTHVQVAILIPLQLSTHEVESLTRYGV